MAQTNYEDSKRKVSSSHEQDLQRLGDAESRPVKDPQNSTVKFLEVLGKEWTSIPKIKHVGTVENVTRRGNCYSVTAGLTSSTWYVGLDKQTGKYIVEVVVR